VNDLTTPILLALRSLVDLFVDLLKCVTEFSNELGAVQRSRLHCEQCICELQARITQLLDELLVRNRFDERSVFELLVEAEHHLQRVRDVEIPAIQSLRERASDRGTFSMKLALALGATGLIAGGVTVLCPVAAAAVLSCLLATEVSASMVTTAGTVVTVASLSGAALSFYTSRRCEYLIDDIKRELERFEAFKTPLMDLKNKILAAFPQLARDWMFQERERELGQLQGPQEGQRVLLQLQWRQ